jgi:NADH dehydrogenase [ubiquinone] 1 alpha subcomplex assembly factor 6
MIGEHAKSEMLVLMRFQVLPGLPGCLDVWPAVAGGRQQTRLGLTQSDDKPALPLLLPCSQWWRDAVNDCYKGQPPSQPVVTALAEVLRVAPLTRYRLQQIVSTREEDLLGHAQPASLAAIERYAEGTAGQLLQLQLEAAGLSSSNSSSGRNDDDGGGGGGSSDEDEAGSGGSSGSSSGCSSSGCSSAEAAVAEHAAAHLGKAVGITGLLRGTYAAGAQRRVYLPADLCQQHGVEEQAVLAGRDSEGLRDVTLAVAAAAKQHLDEARRLVGDAPPAARPLFAPAVATGLYLDALEQCGFNLFDQRILRGAFTPLACQLHLKWAQLRGKY